MVCSQTLLYTGLLPSWDRCDLDNRNDQPRRELPSPANMRRRRNATPCKAVVARLF